MTQIPHSEDSPELLEKFSKDMVYQGNPSAVHIAKDWQCVSEVLEFCNHNQTPITFCGSQSSMTGSSVADSGLALSLGFQNRILDISKDSKTGLGTLITEPGVLLGDIKRAVFKEGFLYPPDPTSYEEAQIGASVATNATGEETFRYGPTRLFVKELEILNANGKKQILKRKLPLFSKESKNGAGYFLNGNDLDEMIGSEGTLGLITKLNLTLLPNLKPHRFILILPFEKFENAIKAVVEIAKHEAKPLALELIGPGASQLFKECPSCPESLQSENLFLYIKDDFADESERDHKIKNWFETLAKIYRSLGESKSFQRVFSATTDQQIQDIRTCRHYIPLKVNETYFPFTKVGGGKVGTDWWVPLTHLVEMMHFTFEQAKASQIPFLVFAHIGNGHPHWNFLTRSAEENARAKAMVLEQCKRAVLYGGGVAGEHGLGKIKRDLLSLQHSKKTIELMQQIKRKWDPNWILGQGNIFKSKLENKHKT